MAVERLQRGKYNDTLFLKTMFILSLGQPDYKLALTSMSKRRREEMSKNAVSKRPKKDVQILNYLAETELVDVLWEKIGVLVKVESSSCLKSSKLPLDSKGYPKNLRLMKKGLAKGKITSEMKAMPCFQKEDFQWSATGLVLIRDQRHPPDSHWEASHTCNHPWCLNPKHLLWEEPQMNYKRKNCLTATRCPTCQHGFNPCVHQPKCELCTIPDCQYHLS